MANLNKLFFDCAGFNIDVEKLIAESTEETKTRVLNDLLWMLPGGTFAGTARYTDCKEALIAAFEGVTPAEEITAKVAPKPNVSPVIPTVEDVKEHVGETVIKENEIFDIDEDGDIDEDDVKLASTATVEVSEDDEDE